MGGRARRGRRRRTRGRPLTAARATAGDDAFISYSHSADARLAKAMERGLERLARPWTRLRAMSVFRDESDLTLNPDLWASISRRLDGSRYLVLMMCPESAASHWVNKEAAHWLETRGSDSMLLVWTGGELAWDAAAADFSSGSTAVLPAIRGRFANEPLYLDMRWAREQADLSLTVPAFRNAVAQVSAPIRGLPPDELVDEDVRLRRRARRLGRAAIVTVVALGIVAVAAAAMAVRNAQRADRRAREAVARQVGLAALDMPASEIDSAFLTTLAAADLASDDDAERFQSARVMIGRYSRLQRLLAVGGDDEYANVRALAFAPDGTILGIAGRADGSSALAHWSAPSGSPRIVALPAGSGSSLRSSGGSVVTAGGSGASLRVDDSADVITLDGSLIDDPDGGRAAWLRLPDGRLSLVALSGDVGPEIAVPPDAVVDAGPARAVALVGDTLTAYGLDGTVQATAEGAVGGSVITAGIEEGTAAIEATVGGSLVRWSLAGDRLVVSSATPLPDQLGDPISLTSSPDGRRVLVVGADGTAVVDLDTGEASTAPGGGTTVVAIDPSGRFVALGGSRLAVWDLTTGQRVVSAPQVASALAWSGPCDVEPRCKLAAAGVAIDVIDPVAETQIRLADEVGAQTVAISRDGATVVSGGWGPTVAVWSVRPIVDDSTRRSLTDSEIGEIGSISGTASVTDPACGVGLRAVSPDGSYTVTVEPTTAVTVLCRSDGSGSRVAVARLDPNAGEVTAAAVDDSGDVVLGRASGIVEQYPVEDGQFRSGRAIDVRVGGEQIAVSTVAARGDVVVAGVRFPGAGATPARVVVWQLATLEPTSFATDFADLAAVAVVDPAASVVAVAGRDRADGPVTVQLWETATLRRVGRAFSGLAGDVTHLVGLDSELVGVDAGGRAYRWEIDRDPTREVCDIVGRALTEEEWDAAAGGALRRYDYEPSCAG